MKIKFYPNYRIINVRLWETFYRVSLQSKVLFRKFSNRCAFIQDYSRLRENLIWISLFVYLVLNMYNHFHELLYLHKRAMKLRTVTKA